MLNTQNRKVLSTIYGANYLRRMTADNRLYLKNDCYQITAADMISNARNNRYPFLGGGTSKDCYELSNNLVLLIMNIGYKNQIAMQCSLQNELTAAYAYNKQCGNDSAAAKYRFILEYITPILRQGATRGKKSDNYINEYDANAYMVVPKAKLISDNLNDLIRNHNGGENAARRDIENCRKVAEYLKLWDCFNNKHYCNLALINFSGVDRIVINDYAPLDHFARLPRF